MSIFPVIHKTGFQRWLDAGDDGLVDVALALFAPFNFDFVVEEFLSVNNGQAAFFSLCGIDQHSFHVCILQSFVFKGPNWANDAKGNALRTWGIAGELLTGLCATEKSVRRSV